MFRKLLMMCAAALSLTGCDQNLTATLYARDINELLAAAEEKSLPLDVEIEILEMGIDKQCSKPEGAKLVEAVSSVFEKAALVGCENISGSMNDRMVIKATTSLSLALTNEVKPGPYLVHFNVQKTDEPNRAFIVARFNAQKYEALNQALRRVSPMASIKIENSRVVVKINNDERSPVTLYPFFGTFAEGDPVDNDWSATLEPRQEVTIKTGDVKTAFLAKNGWAGIANVRTENTSN
ncbi:hypothetical protein [Agrobacterium pusense]